jgi:hypothetical protein
MSAKLYVQARNGKALQVWDTPSSSRFKLSLTSY